MRARKTEAESKKAKAEYLKRWRLANPDKVRAQTKRCRDKHGSILLERTREWRRSNRDTVRKQERAWRKANPAAVPGYERKRRYGINPSTFDAMRTAQNNTCPGCQRTFDESRQHRVCVDHVHDDTKEVRGLLCSLCNLTVGTAKNDPNTLRNLAAYLEAFATRRAALSK